MSKKIKLLQECIIHIASILGPSNNSPKSEPVRDHPSLNMLSMPRALDFEEAFNKTELKGSFSS